MFRRADPGSLTIQVDGQPVRARNGDSVATSLLGAGIQITRRTLVSGAPRGPWCLMGACFDCVAAIDGRRLRTCMTPVQEGMRVDTRRD